jgi:dihydrofolate synthase/folylpolyglutamate synthase
VTYQETVDYLFSLLPVFQNEGKTALNYKLDKTLQLLEVLGNPQNNFKAIHIGGTNGKGTTSHLLAAVLSESGYKVGLYTSPHLKSFTERIKVNRFEIPEAAVIAFVEKYDDLLKELKPSFFEMTVVMAFDYFRNQRVDVAIVEVGLGGRFDSTNILDPDLSIITNISLDHQEFLGGTIAAIADEKAGIIKVETPIIIGEYGDESFPVFEQVATKQNSTLVKAFNLDLPSTLVSKVDANYVLLNKKTAYAAVSQMQKIGYNISDKAIYKAFHNFMVLWQLKGRWQLLGTHPQIICDTGHNEAGVLLLANRLKAYSNQNIHIVWGMASDKDAIKLLKLLPQKASYYYCQAGIPRAMKVEQLQEIAQSIGLVGVVEKNVNKAITLAKKSASKDDLIIVGGSTFVVGEIENL